MHETCSAVERKRPNEREKEPDIQVEMHSRRHA
jgi:hypothetical protein